MPQQSPEGPWEPLQARSQPALRPPTVDARAARGVHDSPPPAEAGRGTRVQESLACWGLGFRVWGLGFRVWGLGFGVWGLGFRAAE